MFQRHSSRIRRQQCQSRGIRSCAGFTLAELITIIVMVGLLSATAAVKYGSYTSIANARTAIDQVAADLRFLQCRTMATMANTTGTYTNTASFSAGARTYFLGGQVKSLPSGVSVSNGLTVTFNSLGEYPTTTNAVLTLNSNGITYSLRIYAVSGDVEAY